jgi:hypothetical protein
MKNHQTYQYVVTPDDVGEEKRDEISGEIRDVIGAESLRFEEADDGVLEMVVSDTIPNARKSDVRETLEAGLAYSFDLHESVVLELHVSWPTPRYRICIGFL